MGAIFIGSYVLDFFGISLPIVCVAGGIVVGMAGLKLLNDQSQDKLLNSVAASHGGQWSCEEITPPQFLSVQLSINRRPWHDCGLRHARYANAAQAYRLAADQSASAMGVLLTTLVVYLCCPLARNMERFLGDIGATVLMRLSAFILLCIGIEIGWAGVSDLMADIRLR